jgi:hypothetical protein
MPASPGHPGCWMPRADGHPSSRVEREPMHDRNSDERILHLDERSNPRSRDMTWRCHYLLSQLVPLARGRALAIGSAPGRKHRKSLGPARSAVRSHIQDAAVTKFLISIPVSLPVRPAEHRLPSMSLRQPRRPDDMPVAEFRHVGPADGRADPSRLRR